ncbi:MAG TPA: sulfotransferase [Candidatus Eremiobacteraceae bacterium]|nr:sulfotransferase [Candidatus Eremiobacteraceae bacterium]
MAEAGTPDKAKLRLSLGAWRQLARKIDPRRARVSRQLRCSYLLSSMVYSALARIQRTSHADALQTCCPSPPIFILGFWRSGTTFLHELLCCDARLGFASTYACLNPSHFLLSEQWVRNRPIQKLTQRPMDNLEYSWASPQEDEFALLALGAPSPYQAILVPSLMRDPQSLLDLGQLPAEDQERWSSSLQYFLRLLTVQQAKTIVLKSPSHGFRMPRLRTLFPGARYIIIERNPYEVFPSNVKLWRTLLESHSLENFSAEEIEEFILAAYVLHERALSEGTRDIDGRFVARVRFEDLEAEPVAEVSRLYRELELGDFECARAGVEQHLASVAGYRRNRFCLRADQKARVERTWGALIGGKGYDWPEDRLSIA